MTATTSPDLAALERRAWRSTTDDGLLDLVLGLWLAGLGASMGTDLDYLPAVAPPVLYGLWLVAKRALIAPRAGTVVFGPERRARVRRGRLALAAASLAVLVLGVGVYALVRGEGTLGESFRAARRVPLGLVIAALVAAASVHLDVPRGLLWALAVALAFVVPHLFDGPTAPVVVATGGAIAGFGLVLLVRFLRAHPVVGEPDDL